MNDALTANPFDLDAFVNIAKTKGVPDAALVPLLRQNGWSERRVYRALSAHYAELLGLAPPRRSGSSESARDGFLYLVSFITLGTWATALGQIFYYLTDKAFPDAIYGSSYYRGGFAHDMAWQLAAVIVAFPTFAFVQRAIEKQFVAKPDAAESGVRKWLTYIALVVTATICMGDAIWFLQGFLTGEVTMRFTLHVTTLATIGGGIFGYYFTGLQRTHKDAK
jgi:hypothetical protein